MATITCECCGTSFTARKGTRYCKAKACQADRQSKAYARWAKRKGPGARNDYQRQYRKTSTTHKDWELKNKYGISYDDWLQILNSQNGKCAICEATEDLVVDHCHTTGKVRGALCRRCNIGIGHFNDEPDRLSKAIEYLKDRLG